jgi:hypothetical protein
VTRLEHWGDGHVRARGTVAKNGTEDKKPLCLTQLAAWLLEHSADATANRDATQTPETLIEAFITEELALECKQGLFRLQMTRFAGGAHPSIPRAM